MKQCKVIDLTDTNDANENTKVCYINDQSMLITCFLKSIIKFPVFFVWMSKTFTSVVYGRNSISTIMLHYYSA